MTSQRFSRSGDKNPRRGLTGSRCDNRVATAMQSLLDERRVGRPGFGGAVGWVRRHRAQRISPATPRRRRTSPTTASALIWPVSTRVSAWVMASLIGKYFSPLYGWIVTLLARSARIWPVGALLKNASLEVSRVSLLSASTCDGKVPLAANAFSCCSGAVSQTGQRLGGLGVLALRRHGQVRPTPVSAATGEGVGDVPALHAGRRCPRSRRASSPGTAWWRTRRSGSSWSSPDPHCSSLAESPRLIEAFSTWS